MGMDDVTQGPGNASALMGGLVLIALWSTALRVQHGLILL